MQAKKMEKTAKVGKKKKAAGSDSAAIACELAEGGHSCPSRRTGKSDPRKRLLVTHAHTHIEIDARLEHAVAGTQVEVFAIIAVADVLHSGRHEEVIVEQPVAAE